MVTELKVEKVEGWYARGKPSLWVHARLHNGEGAEICPISMEAQVEMRVGDSSYELGGTTFLLTRGTMNSVVEPSLTIGDHQGYRAGLRLEGPCARAASQHAKVNGDIDLRFQIAATFLLKEVAGWSPRSLYNRDLVYRISASDWLRWDQQWSRDVVQLLLTGPVARRYREFEKDQAYTNESDALLELLAGWKESALKGATPTTVAVKTTPHQRTIKEAAVSLIQSRTKAQGKLWVMTPYLDASLRPEITSVIRAGAEVRLLTRIPDQKDAKDTLKSWKDAGAGARTNPMVHARMMLTDESVLTSSADLKSDSLDANREFGVITSDPRVVLEAERFFEELWEESAEWDAKTASRPGTAPVAQRAAKKP